MLNLSGEAGAGAMVFLVHSFDDFGCFFHVLLSLSLKWIVQENMGFVAACQQMRSTET